MQKLLHRLTLNRGFIIGVKNFPIWFNKLVCINISVAIKNGNKEGITLFTESWRPFFTAGKLEFENTDFKKALRDLANILKNGQEKPYVVLNDKNDLIDFTFFKLNYLKNNETLKKYESFSLMLDEFYSEKDRKDRIKSQNQSLIKNLNNASLRLNKKLKLLKKCIVY